MSARPTALYLGTVKSSTLDADGCIDVEIDRFGLYKAAVAAMMAGDQRGFVFLPEEGDQVLVATVAGANVQWVVIGNLWSRDDAAPENNEDGKNSTKLIRTRGGNEIRFSDEDGKERIDIMSSSGEVSVSAKKLVLKASDQSTGSITLTGDVKIVGHVWITDDSGTGGVLVVGGQSVGNTTINKNKITGG